MTVLAMIELLSAVAVVIGLTEGGSVSLLGITTESEPEVAAVIAAIDLALAIGLWMLFRWAWTMVMLWRGLILAGALLAYLRGEQPYWEMATSIIVIFYLNQAEVQSAFRRRGPDATEQPS